MALDAEAKTPEPAGTAKRACTRADAYGDCLDACQRDYDACMANAGGDLEKAVCKAAYTKCVANC